MSLQARPLTNDDNVRTLKNCQDEITRLRSIINEVNSWIVCAAIASAEDMMGSAEWVEQITNPDYRGNGNRDVTYEVYGSST